MSRSNRWLQGLDLPFMPIRQLLANHVVLLRPRVVQQSQEFLGMAKPPNLRTQSLLSSLSRFKYIDFSVLHHL